MKLEWKPSEEILVNWGNAKKLEVDGWRLPTRGELIDAYDKQIEGFTFTYSYWSSSKNDYIKLKGKRATVKFDTGFFAFHYKNFLNNVRLCREVAE